MVLDFDLQTFCENLKATKPPYECPFPECGKIYKSYSGIQFHLDNYDHDNPDGGKAGCAKKKGAGRSRGTSRCNTPNRCESSTSLVDMVRSPARPEPLTYAEAQRMVEVELDGNIYRINIHEALDIISQDEIDNCDNTEKEEKPEKVIQQQQPKVAKSGKGYSKNKNKKDAMSNNNNNNNVAPKLPEASFKVLTDYVKPARVPPRPTSYYRYIERSLDELDEEVEYDMDEEDFAWLELLNEQRKKERLDPVSQVVFEQLMDRFEKEAHFQSQSSGSDPSIPIDEDAVCSICMDGECQNTNVILFCDMCNLAVHQECYGVPYIPEGQWLCRRCLQSPSRAVQCCLCPNKGGAFKQTSDNRWAHVVCALWIPEVAFANIVFLEPIDNIDRIPPARWKLSCYICKQRGTGACIQCHKTNCYTAFHVTCAQQAGLYMKIEPVRETGINGTSFNVRKTAFCDVHCPPDGSFLPMMDNGIESDEEKPNTITPAEIKEQSRLKMRQARKILAEKRNATPIVSIPVIPEDRISTITNQVTVAKKAQFVSRLQSYWALKRQSRNGVPLLRRLQSTHMGRSDKQSGPDSSESNALKAQLKYWQRLRQDLEKARLLVELIRKREKLKREELRLHQMATELKLQPLLLLLRETLPQLTEVDTNGFFSAPVSLEEVPDYLDYIDKPMDFSTMETKMESHEYVNFEQFEADFDLIVDNCMKYNSKDTVFYRAAVKLRDQGGVVIRNARRAAQKIGFDSETGLLTPEPPKVTESPTVVVGDKLLSRAQREHIPLEEQLNLLLDRLDEANAASPSQTPHRRKSRLAKKLKHEITNVRYRLALQKGQDTSLISGTDTCQDSEDTLDSSVASPPTSPLKRDRLRSQSQSPDTRAPANSQAPPPRRGRRGRGRGRGRGRYPRKLKEDTDKSDTVEAAPKEDSEEEEGEKTAETPSKSSPPAGVNRRTAVLLNSKRGRRTPVKANKESTTAAEASAPPSQPSRRGRQKGWRGRTASTASSTRVESDSETVTSVDGGAEPEEKLNAEPQDDKKTEPKPPPSPAIRKRSASAVADKPEAEAPPAKKLEVEPAASQGPLSPSVYKKKDSFLSYRSFAHVTSDGDSSSDGNASDTSMSDSDSSSDESGSETEDGNGGPSNRRAKRSPRSGGLRSARKSKIPLLQSDSECETKKLSFDEGPAGVEQACGGDVEGHGRSNSWSSTEDGDTSATLEPLDLVWAKCRGYPWYPALLINPKMPRTGYFHNGVPIPVPPEEVLALQSKYDVPVHLVLFFDAKRTWQWLPRNKLELLGVDVPLDKSKLAENKKPNVKNAVRKAYIKAILHQCQVTGQPNPLETATTEKKDEET